MFHGILIGLAIGIVACIAVYLYRGKEVTAAKAALAKLSGKL